MEWFLVISMFGSDQVLVKPMYSKIECVKNLKEFNKNIKKKIADSYVIEKVTCEQGELMESYEVMESGANDEIM